jgi:hypothetical protein
LMVVELISVSSLIRFSGMGRMRALLLVVVPALQRPKDRLSTLVSVVTPALGVILRLPMLEHFLMVGGIIPLLLRTVFRLVVMRTSFMLVWNMVERWVP